MSTQPLLIEKLATRRLTLIPYTIPLCEAILKDDFSALYKLGLKKGRSWPDADVIDTLPRIINNLSKVPAPTGFESWMIIKSDTLEIIGDAGFKGLDLHTGIIDLGYGIIKEERKKGYAYEAVDALITWAFSAEFITEITASCLVKNTASINLLRKANFVETKFDDELVSWSLSK